MSEEEARRSIAHAQREAEQAAREGEKARQEFEAIEQRQRAGLPPTPRGPPPEARKHQKIAPEKLERRPDGTFMPRQPRQPRQRTIVRREVRIVRQRRSREPFFLRRSPSYKSAPLGEAPAKITPEEKKKVLESLERKIAKVNHKYAFQIKHGGTPEQKQRTKIELQTLENEHKSVQRMHPVPKMFLGGFFGGSAGHVRRAEQNS